MSAVEAANFVFGMAYLADGVLGDNRIFVHAM
jgi:hypothetical protein